MPDVASEVTQAAPSANPVQAPEGLAEAVEILLACSLLLSAASHLRGIGRFTVLGEVRAQLANVAELGVAVPPALDARLAALDDADEESPGILGR